MRSIRRSLARDVLSANTRKALASRLLAGEADNLQPILPDHDHVKLFGESLMRVSAQLTRLPDRRHVPAQVTRYFNDESISGQLVVAPALEDLDWECSKFAVHFGRAEGGEVAGISQAYCGIAETGSLVLLSGADNPTTINFLPDHHLVILHQMDIVPHMEDVWMRMRSDSINWPRTVNIITGPSRTADIEQTIQLGAHGPRRLHVLLLDK